MKALITPGCNHHPLVGEVNFKNAAHARQADHHAIGHRQRAAAQAGSGAARDKRNLVLMADADHRLHLLAAFGQQNRRRQHAEIGQAIALVGFELAGLGNQAARAERGAKCIQDLPVHKICPSVRCPMGRHFAFGLSPADGCGLPARAVPEKLYPLGIVLGRRSLLVAPADGPRLRDTPPREPL